GAFETNCALIPRRERLATEKCQPPERRNSNLLPANHEGRNHPATRRHVSQFIRRESRKCRTYFSVEEQWVEVDKLLSEGDAAIVSQRGKALSGRGPAFLHQIIAVCQGVVDRFVPTDFVGVPAD